MGAEVWTLIGLLPAVAFGVLGIVIPVVHRMENRLDGRMDKLEAGLGGRMDKLEGHVRELDHHVAGRLDALSARLDQHLVAHERGG